MSETVIVLAMHGAPPSDFPKAEVGEFLGLHARLEYAEEPERSRLLARHAYLESKLLEWPRTASNDPFWASSQNLASRLQQQTGLRVSVGFNEFCAPALGEALEQAMRSGVRHVVVVTPMLTRGGEHAERDIRRVIRQAQQNRPDVAISYAWPYHADEIVRMLANRVQEEVCRFEAGGQAMCPGVTQERGRVS